MWANTTEHQGDRGELQHKRRVFFWVKMGLALVKLCCTTRANQDLNLHVRMEALRCPPVQPPGYEYFYKTGVSTFDMVPEGLHAPSSYCVVKLGGGGGDGSFVGETDIRVPLLIIAATPLAASTLCFPRSFFWGGVP